MKRELEELPDVSDASRNVASDDGDEDDGTDVSMINVDFEFFDLNPKVDFHALNTLFKQLFGPDAVSFELGAIADLILEQAIGSTVKVDGEESDPYAILTTLNMNKNREHAQVRLLTEYLLAKSKKSEKCYKLLSKLLGPDPKGQTALLLSERLINMPVEVSPPLYRILAEELASKSSSDSSYTFNHFILWSKSYTEILSKLDTEDDRPKKKGKTPILKPENFYFHAEDEILIKHASQRVQFQYSHGLPEADSKRAFHDFGIKPSGELIIFTKEQLADAIAEIQIAFPF